MAAHKLVEDRRQRGACSEGNDVEFACRALGLDVFFNAVGNVACALFYGREDVCRNFFHTRKLGTVYRGLRLVELLRHFVQYNL